MSLLSSARPRVWLSQIQLVSLVDRVILAVAFIFVIAANPARANTSDAGSLRLVTPGDATSGTLLLEAEDAGRYVQAPIVATDVKIEVSGPFARTRVTQRFENPANGWVEGVYVFPLPDGAAVDTLKMQIGDRFIEGQIEERKKAKAIYEQAKAEGKKASLLEQERANIFTNSVANIGPGEVVIVQIEYQETARFSDGAFSLRFPMVVAPRYNPAPIVQTVNFTNEDGGFAFGNDPVPDRDRIEPPYLDPEVSAASNPVTLEIDIDAGFPLGSIATPFHQTVVQRDDMTAEIKLAEGHVPADRDFGLTWKPKAGAAPSAALFVERIDGENFYLAMITPPTAETAQKTPPREVIFVIDTSGSMAGESIRQARASLKLALARLKPADRFNVIEFNSSMRAFYPNAVDATPAAINQAIAYVDSLQAQGGTEMLSALNAALVDQHKNGNFVRQVIFLTDGAIGNEAQLFETIAASRGRSRIFTVGIGSAPNSFFMSRAAEIGQGTFTHIGNVAQVSERMNALFAKLETPAVTDLAMSWPAGVVVEAWPSPLPDVYRSEPVVIAARASSEKGRMSLSGRQGEQAWTVNLPLEQASKRKGVSKLWARRKIAALELNIARKPQERAPFEASILKTALAHSLVSRLTSLVAIDVTSSRPSDAPITETDVPLNLPAGWDFGAVFGETLKPLDREAMAPGVDMIRTRLVDASSGEAVIEQPQKGVALPQGATLSDVKLGFGLIMILLSLGIFIGSPCGAGLSAMRRASAEARR